MEVKKIAGLLLTSFIVAFIVGCSKDYQVAFVFKGTVQEKLIKEEMIVVKEYGGENQGRKPEDIYEIPVEDIEQYEAGQKLKVTVLSNTETDDWDLDHLKFEIEKIEK